MPAKIESPLLTGDRDQERENLRILLIKNNTSPTEIGEILGISSQAVSNVVHRHDNIRRVLEYFENMPVQI